MTSRSERERAKQEALRLHRAANQKISRNRRMKGIELAGTSWDIRRDIAKVKRYNINQLNAYIRELTTFTSRSTNFVPGAKGSILPANKLREYKAQERKYNAAGKAFDAANNMDTINGVTGLSPNERRQVIGNPRNRAENQPYIQKNVQPHHIPDEASLDKLIRDLKKKNSSDYLPSQVKRTRENIKNLLNVGGEGNEIQERISKLSDDQLMHLASYTSFMENNAIKYYMNKSLESDEKQRYHDRSIDNAHSENMELINYVENNFRPKLQSAKAQLAKSKTPKHPMQVGKMIR